MPGGFSYSPIFASPDRMIVWNSWTPVSEQGRIFDMSGKQLAIIGANRFSVLEPNLNTWLVQGTEWVTSGEVNTLVTVDVPASPLDGSETALIAELAECDAYHRAWFPAMAASYRPQIAQLGATSRSTISPSRALISSVSPSLMPSSRRSSAGMTTLPSWSMRRLVPINGERSIGEVASDFDAALAHVAVRAR